MSKVYEVNFDGLIGPTHTFAGLSVGNLASDIHRFSVSSPQKAALEGLAKMKLLHSFGIKQGIIPPQLRPDVDYLRNEGFEGPEEEVLARAADENFPVLLAAASASAMWTANAATVSPSPDTENGKVHITAANLVSHKHRAIEAGQTFKFLKDIFRSEQFSVHGPLGDPLLMLDEGAANHMRLSSGKGGRGLNIFVYGKEVTNIHRSHPRKFPARQSLEASREIARQHGLAEGEIIFCQQNPEAIDKGVFHNDVIATSNANVFLYHSQAFVRTGDVIGKISAQFKKITGGPLCLIAIDDEELTVEEAVNNYLFNSQIVTLPSEEMIMIVPQECNSGRARDVIEKILADDNPIGHVQFVGLNQSMSNGGGPACLRLRVNLSEEELAGVHPGYLMDDAKFTLIEEWIRKHYREALAVEDLKDFALLQESKNALGELREILDSGEIYPF